MKKALTHVTLILVIVLALSSFVTAQFEVAFPFMETQVVDYYVRSKITTHAPREISQIVEVHKKGDLIWSVVEIDDQTFSYGYDVEESWVPDMEDYLELFFSNYEMRLVGVETVARHEALVIELVSKQTELLRHRYFLDQKTGLVLNQDMYDREGNLTTSYEALEVDYEPDFPTLDFDMIDFELSLPHYPLSEAELKASLPWFNLDFLTLPATFQVVGYSQLDLDEGDLDGTTTKILVWASDGYESVVLEIASAAQDQVILDQDTVLEIVEYMPSSIIAEVVDQPITFSLRGSSLGPDEAITILSSLSPAQKIANPETLRFEMFARGETIRYPLDYSKIPQEALTEAEFFRLAPMAFRYASTFPQDLKVVGYAKVYYSEDQKNSLPIYERHPDLSLEDLVIIFSDGERFHHVGLSFAPNYTDYELRGQSIRHFQSGVSVLFNDWPIAFFSHSTFLSYEEQMDIIEELGKGYVINPK